MPADFALLCRSADRRVAGRRIACRRIAGHRFAGRRIACRLVHLCSACGSRVTGEISDTVFRA